MAITREQYKEDGKQDFGGIDDVSATFDSTPTSGNFLLAWCAVDKDSGAITGPSGWTKVHENIDSSISISIYKKTSAGNESAAIEFSFANPQGVDAVIRIEEYSNTDGIDVDANDDSSNGVVTSQSTGTTDTTTVAKALALAFWGVDTLEKMETSRAYTNSFTELTFHDDGMGNSPCGMVMASKTLSSTGTQECTFSASDTGDQIAAAILVLKETPDASSLVPPYLFSGAHAR